MQTNAKKIAYVAMFTAFGVVVNLLSFSVPPFGRASFVYLFSNIAGIVLGPWLGFASGICADLLPALVAPQGPWMPLITLSNGLMCMIPGLVFRYIPWKSFTAKLALSAAISLVVCTLGVGAWGSVPLLNIYFPSAVALGEKYGITSPYLMLAFSKLLTQPFWIVVNCLLTSLVYVPIRKFSEQKVRK